MLLRAAIVVLLMLNLGVAGWWLAGGDAHSRPAAVASDGGVPRLHLARRAPPPAASSVPDTASATHAIAAVQPSPSSMDPPKAAAAHCLRFGPFADAAARDALRPALAAATRLVPHENAGRASRGWRVYLPPLPSHEAATAAAEQMKAAGIDDLYVMNEGDESNSIALGRYGNEEAARRREADLRARGFAAQAAPLGASAPQWWLDARLPATAERARLARLAASRPLDCAELR